MISYLCMQTNTAMSNYVLMMVVLEGERRELKSLYGKMLRLQNRKEPLVKNGFFNPTRWLGNLVVRLGGDWHDYHCRGTWDELELSKGTLCFYTETAWQAPFGVLKLIQQVYPTVRAYFSAEGDDWDAYLTNDAEGRYFPARYVVDMEPDIEYFNTIEEVSQHLLPMLGRKVTSTEELNEAVEAWQSASENADKYLSVKEFELVSLDEL